MYHVGNPASPGKIQSSTHANYFLHHSHQTPEPATCQTLRSASLSNTPYSIPANHPIKHLCKILHQASLPTAWSSILVKQLIQLPGTNNSMSTTRCSINGKHLIQQPCQWINPSLLTITHSRIPVKHESTIRGNCSLKYPCQILIQLYSQKLSAACLSDMPYSDECGTLHPASFSNN